MTNGIDLPMPDITPLNRPWWEALKQGRLMLPVCTCGHRWLPASAECPDCLQAGRWTWTVASGRASVVSWVVYHTAYHAAWKDRLPYNVAIVELDEGPRLMTNLLVPLADIRIGLRVALKTVEVQGLAVAHFATA